MNVFRNLANLSSFITKQYQAIISTTTLASTFLSYWQVDAKIQM